MITTIVGVGGGTLAVLAVSGTHAPWSSGRHDPWASAAIAAIIIGVVAAVALLAASRARRGR